MKGHDASIAGDLRWPPEQLLLEPKALAALAERCRPAFVDACRTMDIDADLTPLLTSMYVPLAAWLRKRRSGFARALVVGVCGAQGSGKSTVCTLLKVVMAEAFDEHAAVLSIDDIYEPRERRQALARDVHPMFATRGVPGTHDVALGMQIIRRLASQGSGGSTAVPVFDKAIDTRLPPSDWPSVDGRMDYVMFEGWCVGAIAQTDQALAAPVNELEREEDPDGSWRRTVNRHLADEYQRLFALLNVLLLLRVQGMRGVFQWRRLQEQKLAARVACPTQRVAGSNVMSDAEVDRFIRHYERLTRHILQEMPERADMVFDLDESHTPARVHINV